MKPTAEILVCDKHDELWDEYFLLLMRRYLDLGLPYDFDMTLSFIGNPIVAGDALIARSLQSGETIGVLGFVFGSGSDHFTDTSVCQIEALYIDKKWRHSKVVALMLLKFVDYLQQRHLPIERIQFWSPSDRSDLHRMFTKFSDCIKTNDKSFGRISLYQTTMDRIAEYTRRFRRRIIYEENIENELEPEEAVPQDERQ